MIRKELDWLECITGYHCFFLPQLDTKYPSNLNGQNSFRNHCCNLLLAYAYRRFTTADADDLKRWQRLRLVMGPHIQDGDSIDKVFGQREPGLYHMLSHCTSIYDFHRQLIMTLNDPNVGDNKLRKLIQKLLLITHHHLATDQGYGQAIEAKINSPQQNRHIKVAYNVLLEQFQKTPLLYERLKDQLPTTEQALNKQGIPYRILMRYSESLYTTPALHTAFYDFLSAIENYENKKFYVTGTFAIDIGRHAGCYDANDREEIQRRIDTAKSIMGALSPKHPHSPCQQQQPNLFFLHQQIIAINLQYDHQPFYKKWLRKKSRTLLMQRLLTASQQLKQNPHSALEQLTSISEEIRAIDGNSSLARLVTDADLQQLISVASTAAAFAATEVVVEAEAPDAEVSELADLPPVDRQIPEATQQKPITSKAPPEPAKPQTLSPTTSSPAPRQDDQDESSTETLSKWTYSASWPQAMGGGNLPGLPHDALRLVAAQ